MRVLMLVFKLYSSWVLFPSKSAISHNPEHFSMFLQTTKGDSKNAKKKNNKKTSKNKSSLSRANKKKPGMPNVSNDLSQKLYATMEKHKEV